METARKTHNNYYNNGYIIIMNNFFPFQYQRDRFFYVRHQASYIYTDCLKLLLLLFSCEEIAGFYI